MRLAVQERKALFTNSQMELMFVDFCLAKLWVIETPHIKELCLLFEIEEKEKTGLNSCFPDSDGMRYRI